MVGGELAPVGEAFAHPLTEGHESALVIGKGAGRDVLLDRKELEELLGKGVGGGWHGERR